MPLQLDRSWIKALQDFDKSNTVKYLAKFNGTLPSNPIERDEYFAKLNKYFVKRYSSVFTKNLPDRAPHPDSTRHCIILENKNISLNGRNYRILT